MVATSAVVVRAASDVWGVDALAKMRSRTHHGARQTIVWLLRSSPQRPSYPELGRLLGRDHSTVISAERSAFIRLRTEPEFAVMLERVRDRALELGATPADLDRTVGDIHELGRDRY